MSRPREERQRDLFRPALEAIIDLKHPLVRLGERIDWEFVERRLGGVYKPGSGQPPLPIRLMAGLLILKHMHSLSDEALCARWLENPYFQYFCGELAFRHELPFDRTSLTRWRQRLGEERLAALLQESLRVAHDTGALETKDLERVAVDTTVQPKKHRPPHRRPPDPQGHHQAGGFRQEKRHQSAPKLFAGLQTGGDHGRALYSCPPVQAGRPPA